MDNLLKQAHAILRLGRELEEIVTTWFLLITVEKDHREQIDKKAAATIELEQWCDILPVKGDYFRLSHYVATLKQLMRESKRIPSALEQMAVSPTLDAIHTFCVKAVREPSSPRGKYSSFSMGFKLRCLEVTKSFDKPSVCLEAVHLAQTCPLLDRAFRHFISRVSLPLSAAADRRIEEFQKNMDRIPEIGGEFLGKILFGIHAECAQVVALSFLEIAPIKARSFLLPSHQRLLEALKNAELPLTYDALGYEAGIGSRSTVAEGLKTLEQLGLAKKLPGGGTVHIDKAIPDTGGTTSKGN